jgi:hypothetical protein
LFVTGSGDRFYNQRINVVDAHLRRSQARDESLLKASAPPGGNQGRLSHLLGNVRKVVALGRIEQDNSLRVWLNRPSVKMPARPYRLASYQRFSKPSPAWKGNSGPRRAHQYPACAIPNDHSRRW